ncbi:hypothetical protein UPYG_G00301350 [Umbra pygmaea]|uniref:IF rod domain-containing protein n=1 Tax=Umbra pygmaea TaxID=75934 RepID=A0ABD0WW76_UMBPY
MAEQKSHRSNAAVLTRIVNVYRTMDSSPRDTTTNPADLPELLTALYDVSLRDVTLDKIQVKSEESFQRLKENLTRNQCETLELISREQAKCQAWHQHRVGRITSTAFHRVCNASKNTDRINLVKKTMHYGESELCHVPAVRWGRDMEETARQHYKVAMSKAHDHFTLNPSGLVVRNDQPHLGASPDGLVNCSCCGRGTLEVKCPYKYRDESPDTIKSHEPRDSGCLTQQATKRVLKPLDDVRAGRRSSFLSQPVSSELPGSANPRAAAAGITTAPRGVFVGTAPVGGVSSMGTRVSRRALGISSVFLQGLRSTSVPVVSRGTGGGQHARGAESLNGCLMEYRDKVHALEQLNQQLEEQIRHCLDRKASSAGAWGPLKQEWEDVYRQVSESILDNARLMLQTENVQGSAEDFKERYENEEPFRKAVEEEINSLYKVIDDANLTKADLESQIDSMRAELRDLAHNHEEDVRVLYNQMAGREVDEPNSHIETNLDQILSHIRTHWERVIEKNRTETDAYLEYKQAECVGSKLSREEEELESLKTECNDAGCKIQSLQAETESIRALKRGLENSLSDAKHWHGIELQNLGSIIGKLESELGDVRCDIEQQRRDYETLLGNKMRLELEIGTYHGILDGEESRYHPCMCPGASEPEGNLSPPPPPSVPDSSPAPQGSNKSFE